MASAGTSPASSPLREAEENTMEVDDTPERRLIDWVAGQPGGIQLDPRFAHILLFRQRILAAGACVLLAEARSLSAAQATPFAKAAMHREARSLSAAMHHAFMHREATEIASLFPMSRQPSTCPMSRQPGPCIPYIPSSVMQSSCNTPYIPSFLHDSDELVEQMELLQHDAESSDDEIYVLKRCALRSLC